MLKGFAKKDFLVGNNEEYFAGPFNLFKNYKSMKEPSIELSLLKQQEAQPRHSWVPKSEKGSVLS